jgi:hypothetical protein
MSIDEEEDVTKDTPSPLSLERTGRGEQSGTTAWRVRNRMRQILFGAGRSRVNHWLDWKTRDRQYHGGDEFDLGEARVPATAHNAPQQPHCDPPRTVSEQKRKSAKRKRYPHGASRRGDDGGAARAPRHATPLVRSFASVRFGHLTRKRQRTEQIRQTCLARASAITLASNISNCCAKKKHRINCESMRAMAYTSRRYPSTRYSCTSASFNSHNVDITRAVLNEYLSMMK